MLWSKVLSDFLLQPAKSDLEIFLRNCQFGIGTPQGRLAMTTALTAHLTDHPTHVVACLEFKNDFGIIDRVTCMKALRELCPQNHNHLAMTYDGLPQGGPLGTLVLALTMTVVIHKLVRETTSEVATLSCIDDAVLVGPADDIADVIQTLPRGIATAGLSLQPQKTQLWAPEGDQITQKPSLKLTQAQMKDPRGLIILGEALGEHPTDPYTMGNETFIQDHPRDVTKAVANDLRKIAILPDKLEGDTAGLQVAWALISKSLPPRVAHLLRAHPVEQTQEMCNTLQDALTLSDSC